MKGDAWRYWELKAGLRLQRGGRLLRARRLRAAPLKLLAPPRLGLRRGGRRLRRRPARGQSVSQ